MKDEVVAWLRLFRAHTAILEVPLAVTGAVLGLGTFWHIDVVAWALFGVIYHFAGYGMNSYVDWKKGFDKDDPYKQHHPLNTRTLSPSEAKKGVYAVLCVLIITALVLTGPTLQSVGLILLMLVSGVAYNYFGKLTSLKFIPIAIVHTMVFILPYQTYSSGFSILSLLVAGAIFTHQVFQIMISGDIKDITQDEASLLQDMGAQVMEISNGEKILTTGDGVQVAGYFLVILEISLIVSVLTLGSTTLTHIVITSAFSAAMLYYSDKVIQDGVYVRTRRIRSMSLKELSGVAMILTSITAVVGATPVFVVLGANLAYFLPVSKLLWGNWVRPEV
jgi:4-hydroxybenzoate polyprenyltransferase